MTFNLPLMSNRHLFTRLKYLFSVAVLVWSTSVGAQSGIYESYAILSLNGGANSYYDMQATTGNPDFQGANLGSYLPVNSIVIKGGQNKTFKCSGCDITNGNLWYSVYPTGFPTGTFVQLPMSFVSNFTFP